MDVVISPLRAAGGATIAALMLLGGCGDGASVQSDGESSTTTVQQDATTPSWLSVGDEIERGRDEAAERDYPDGAEPEITTFGPYISSPVNITSDGSYEFVFGPLEDEDVGTESLTGISFPPDAVEHFDLSVDLASALTRSTESGSVLVLNVEVSNFKKEYPGLTAWAQ